MAGRKTSHAEAWWAKAPAHIVRCSARYKTGDDCRREAVPGSNVCGQHGGSAPQVIAAAQTRVAMSAEKAAEWLISWMNDPKVDVRERLKAAESLLDRSGVSGVDRHLIGVVTQDPVEALFRSIASDPHGTYDPATVTPRALPAPDPAQAALDAAEDVPDFHTFLARQNGADDGDDVVDAEVVDDEAAAHTVHVEQSRPPKWLRDDLERLGLL